MKKLFVKLLLCLIPVLIYVGIVYYTDPFDVFHYRNIRMTESARNYNFIKTKNMLENPDKYNAFIFGSSRVGNIPKDKLPAKEGGKALSWYNMTYPMGCPKDHLETLETFLKNGVDVRMVIIGIDEISMYNTYEKNSQDPIKKQYGLYEKNPLRFFYDYITIRPSPRILYQVMNQSETDRADRAIFYDYGVESRNCNISKPSEDRKMAPTGGCEQYVEGREQSEPVQAIRDIRRLCEENGIKLVIFTSPILKTTYLDAVEKGYFDFLSDVATVTDFYNFSGLNKYTEDMKYYFDASHYKPYVGLKIEEKLFEEAVTTEVTDFGAHITSDNIEELISVLKTQL